jgi:hypothetical protein
LWQQDYPTTSERNPAISRQYGDLRRLTTKPMLARDDAIAQAKKLVELVFLDRGTREAPT